MSVEVKRSPGRGTGKRSLSSRSGINSRATTPTVLAVSSATTTSGVKTNNSSRSVIKVLPPNGNVQNLLQKTESVQMYSPGNNNNSRATLSPLTRPSSSSPSPSDCSSVNNDDALARSPSPPLLPTTIAASSPPVQLISPTSSAKLSSPFLATIAPASAPAPATAALAAALNLPRSTTNSYTSNRMVIVPQPDGQQQRRWINSDRLNELRKRTHEAIRNHKVFTVRGCFTTVRKALLLRGYVEKLDQHRRASMALNLTMDEMIHQLPNRQPGESKRQYISKCERNIISRFLEHTPVDFLWTFRKEKADWIDMARNPILTTNKFHKVPFTTKEGICAILRDFHWFYIEGVSELYYPRCYNVFNPDELDDFVEDFRLTACISMIRFVIDTFNNKGVSALLSDEGTIPVTSLQFAIKRCRDFVNFSEHYDVDSCEDRMRIWDHDWDVFLSHHYYLTHENGRITENQMSKPFDVYLSMAAKVLQDLEPFWPQFNIDGHLNIWIVKPANRCRGKGILLMNNIKKIISLVNPSTITKTRFVVQKYMERPLTIYNTKFDIRQWFLITSVQPLCVWMYRESYLRFSSQEYNLHNYHESVHLTNYAVQKKYVVGQERDDRLPSENMWDCHTFQAYLRQIGKQDMWTDRIYPGMQRAIIGTMLASQDSMDRRPNTFELFGADFMICENYYPWLIEINSSPDLGNTTSVTARMCPQCLEDTIKVVVDRKNDPKADTGAFELIYKQNIPPSPAYMGLNLFLKGQQITQRSSNGAGGVRKDKFNSSNRDENNNYNRSNLKQIVSRNSTSGNTTNVVGGGGGGGTPAAVASAATANGSERLRKGPVIMDLIDCLDVKNAKRPPVIGNNRNSSVGARTGQQNQIYLKSKNKVDVDYKEKSNLSSRRHHSCGPAVLRQSTMSGATAVVAAAIRIEDGSGGEQQQHQGGKVGEEPLIVPIQGDSNLMTCIGNRVDHKEELFSLPLISATRKFNSETAGGR